MLEQFQDNDRPDNRGWKTWLVMLTAILVVVGLGVWTFKPFLGDVDSNNQKRGDQLIQQWSSPPPPSPSPLKEPVYPRYNYGEQFAVISIPKLNMKAPVGEGIGVTTLSQGIGHYPITVKPGQLGNFATAGHVCCRSHGQPYKHINKLRVGDEIDVTTKDATYVYQVVRMPSCSPKVPALVRPEDIQVIWSTPCVSADRTRRLMTMTTCYPDRSMMDLRGRPAPYRLIVWAELLP